MTPPEDERSRPPEGRLHRVTTATQDQPQSTADWPDGVVRRVPFADLLAIALDVHAFVATNSVQFHCPSCQDEEHLRILNGPCAESRDDWSWRCAWCGAKGTRRSLERLVVEDPDAFDRLLAWRDDGFLPAA